MTTKRTYYPSARADGFVYYHADNAWWRRRTDATDTGRESVLLLDVLIGVSDQTRTAVIKENERMVSGKTTMIGSVS
jgi:hypothetical protein